MSRWSHAICENYWSETPEALDGHEPVRLREPQGEICCFCGDATRGGIYIRHDPAGLRCGGQHWDEPKEVNHSVGDDDVERL